MQVFSCRWALNVSVYTLSNDRCRYCDSFYAVNTNHLESPQSGEVQIAQYEFKFYICTSRPSLLVHFHNINRKISLRYHSSKKLLNTLNLSVSNDFNDLKVPGCLQAKHPINVYVAVVMKKSQTHLESSFYLYDKCTTTPCAALLILRPNL